jgi:hypothetical protein
MIPFDGTVISFEGVPFEGAMNKPVCPCMPMSHSRVPMYAYVPFEGAHVCLCPIRGCYDTGFFQVGGSTPRDPHHVHDSVVHLAQRE